MSLRDWFTGPDADYDLDDARADVWAEQQQPARPKSCRFDACWGCGVYLPLPKTGGRRVCADCAPHYTEMMEAMR